MADTELNLTDILEIDPTALDESQKTFLEDNKSDLTPEQAVKFNIKQDVIIEDFEPETRRAPSSTTIKKDDEGDDSDIDEEDERTISKIVEKKLAPMSETMTRIQKLEDEKDIDSFLSSKPEYLPYRANILKHVAHSAYQNIPVHNIAAMLAAKDMMKIGAEKEREAQRKIKETGGNGFPARKFSGGIDWGTATAEQMAAKRAEVMGHSG